MTFQKFDMFQLMFVHKILYHKTIKKYGRGQGIRTLTNGFGDRHAAVNINPLNFSVYNYIHYDLDCSLHHSFHRV